MRTFMTAAPVSGYFLICSLYMMIGENDFVVESNKAAERMMMENCVQVKHGLYEGLGHAFPPNGKEELTKALQWIAAAE